MKPPILKIKLYFLHIRLLSYFLATPCRRYESLYVDDEHVGEAAEGACCPPPHDLQGTHEEKDVVYAEEEVVCEEVRDLLVEDVCYCVFVEAVKVYKAADIDYDVRCEESDGKCVSKEGKYVPKEVPRK